MVSGREIIMHWNVAYRMHALSQCDVVHDHELLVINVAHIKLVYAKIRCIINNSDGSIG